MREYTIEIGKKIVNELIDREINFHVRPSNSLIEITTSIHDELGGLLDDIEHELEFTKRYQLMVKGLNQEPHAINKLALTSDSMRIEQTAESEASGMTIITIQATFDLTMILNNWFIESPNNPPYPQGSLLHWMPLKEKN